MWKTEFSEKEPLFPSSGRREGDAAHSGKLLLPLKSELHCSSSLREATLALLFATPLLPLKPSEITAWRSLDDDEKKVTFNIRPRSSFQVENRGGGKFVWIDEEINSLSTCLSTPSSGYTQPLSSTMTNSSLIM
ncbi:uncharacterized protein LOC122089482 [Macadamia integrifolia]|uniref:uncharacterized protein LOC122089482 n=1 Tax=Macadamia integrifolia TaxID=60698 RepID=UPI001C4E5760|nr:uncharacterized protein LOC122089482 [Macadamia integrifolia]